VTVCVERKNFLGRLEGAGRWWRRKARRSSGDTNCEPDWRRVPRCRHFRGEDGVGAGSGVPGGVELGDGIRVAAVEELVPATLPSVRV